MKELKSLLQIKKIIALAMTLVFVVLSLRGQVDVQNFLSVFLTIIAFYFGQSTARNSRKDL